MLFSQKFGPAAFLFTSADGRIPRHHIQRKHLWKQRNEKQGILPGWTFKEVGSDGGMQLLMFNGLIQRKNLQEIMVSMVFAIESAGFVQKKTSSYHTKCGNEDLSQ